METATLHCHDDHCHSHDNPDGLSPMAWILAFAVVGAIIAFRAPVWIETAQLHIRQMRHNRKR